MEYIKNQTAQTRGFLLMMALVIGIFKISGSVIAENWSWVGILSLLLLSFIISEIYFFQFKKKANKRMSMRGKFGL